ncbi:MAG: hypothetical protein ACYCS7_15240 [Acidimicrobiales bacterium]
MATPFRITFLGEIGPNCAMLESDGELLILDCGILFPDADMPEVDLVCPTSPTCMRTPSGSSGAWRCAAMGTTWEDWRSSCGTCRSPYTAPS